MEYNDYLLENLPYTLENIIRLVDRFSTEYKIEDVKVSIEDPELTDPSEYLTTYSSYDFLVTIEYTLNTGDVKYLSLNIPKMINNMFIIQGKYRLINRYLSDDTEFVKVGRYFRFYYGFSYNIETGLFDYMDPESGEVDQFNYDELNEAHPEAFDLSDRAAKKLQIITNSPTRVTRLDKSHLLQLASTKIENTDVINKRIISIENILISSLRREKFDLVKAVSGAFYKYGSISASPIQTLIDKVFYNQGSELHAINYSSNVNPYSFDSANAKVLIEYSGIDNIKPQEYSIGLADLLDPIVTPDNANVNRINYLNNSTSISGQSIMMKVLDKEFNEVSIEYLDYITSRVVPYRFVDYENKTIQEDFKIIQNKIEKDSKEYDYIQCHPDERLSILTRAIPCMNMTDSVRTAMAARMITQSVPLAKPDTPRIQSGHESDQSKSTTSIKFDSTVSGKVIEVTDKVVKVDTDGIIKEYSVPKPVTGIYDITASFSPAVKVGDELKQGDVIITHNIAKSGNKNIGLNALTAFMPYRGYNYEDGVIISESFADRLSHYSIIDIDLYLRETDSIVDILPIGTPIKSRDIIINTTSEFNNQMNDKLLRLLVSKNDLSKRNNLVVPNNIDKGYIIDINYSYDNYAHDYGKAGVRRLELNQESKSLLESCKKHTIKLPEDIDKSYIANIDSLPDYDGYAAIIRVRLLCINKGRVGTKLSNLYGSKGVVSKVVPDKEMIRTEDGRIIDVILNSDAVFSRKNISQIMVMQLVLVADKILELGKDRGLEEFKKLLAKYGLNEYLRKSDDELNDILTSDQKLNYVTGCYSKFTMQQVQEWMDELGISDKVRVIDGKTNRLIRNPIIVSTMYMIKLYHLPEKYNKVHTPSSYASPVLGFGEIRSGGGQMQGEMEFHALAASDLGEYIKKERNKFSFRDAKSLSISMYLTGIDLSINKEDDKE